MKQYLYKSLGVVFLVSSTILCSAQTPAGKISLHLLKLHNEKDTRAYFHYTGKDLPIISAHRGGSWKGYAENTIPAFEHTLSITPAMFEIDPHLTKDNIPVMMHDPTVNRTTNGHGKVNTFTLQQFRALKVRDAEGNVLSDHPSTLEEVIEWAIGKTVINLDIKDVPPLMKAELVKKHNAFENVIFTVHTAQQAKVFYDFDKRCLFAAVVFNMKDLKSYEAAGIPWSNIAIAYVGSHDKPENKPLYDQLHRRGVMVMVAAAPTYDKLATVQERADAYRQIIKDGADIIESNLPAEVAAAIQPLYPKHSKRYRFWTKSR